MRNPDPPSVAGVLSKRHCIPLSFYVKDGALCYNGWVDHISSHIFGPKKPIGRATERGELMQYFLGKLNAARARDDLASMSIARMGRVLVAIPTQDLYYLKSVCDQASDFSKKFWWEVNPKKHEKKNEK